MLGKPMRIPGTRTLVGMLVVLLSKHQAGITVLRKRLDVKTAAGSLGQPFNEKMKD